MTPPMAAPAAFVFRNRAVGPVAALQGEAWRRPAPSGERPHEAPTRRSPGPRYQSSHPAWAVPTPSGLPAPPVGHGSPGKAQSRLHPTRQTCPRWLCGSVLWAHAAGQGLTPCALVPSLSSSPGREGALWDSGAHRWVKTHYGEGSEQCERAWDQPLQSTRWGQEARGRLVVVGSSLQSEEA